MKNFKLILIVSLFPIFSAAQDLTGLWMGKLSNDSVSERKDQTYELALTEYRGKIYGYSYTTFIYHDTLYYIVKRVKGRITDSICEVEDDEIVSHNFSNPRHKKVKVTQTFRLNKADSTWSLDGKWKTNKTKEYYALTGGIDLKQEKDFDKSAMLQHLGDLNRDKDIAFYKPEQKVYLSAPRKTKVRKEDPLIAKNGPNAKKPSLNSGVEDLDIRNPEPSILKKAADKQDPVIAKTDSKNPNLNSGLKDLDIKNPEPSVVNKEAEKQNSVIAKADPSQKKPDLNSGVGGLDIKNPEPSVINKAADKNNPSVENANPAQKKPDLNSGITQLELKNPLPSQALDPQLEARKKNIIQTVDYKTDSLVLSLYDNGEVDGDTVSVFINGESLIERQGLKSTALKKTIYLKSHEYEEVEILLFAENLGKFPPNTGLLIIYDGTDRYEIRFSADYEQSAAILLRRKKN